MSLSLPNLYRSQGPVDRGDGFFHYPVFVLAEGHGCRPVLKGEWFLPGSGGNEACLALVDLREPGWILRRATPEEMVCPCCKRARETER